jgi:hypothetical protein
MRNGREQLVDVFTFVSTVERRNVPRALSELIESTQFKLKRRPELNKVKTHNKYFPKNASPITVIWYGHMSENSFSHHEGTLFIRSMAYTLRDFINTPKSEKNIHQVSVVQWLTEGFNPADPVVHDLLNVGTFGKISTAFGVGSMYSVNGRTAYSFNKSTFANFVTIGLDDFENFAFFNMETMIFRRENEIQSILIITINVVDAAGKLTPSISSIILPPISNTPGVKTAYDFFEKVMYTKQTGGDVSKILTMPKNFLDQTGFGLLAKNSMVVVGSTLGKTIVTPQKIIDAKKVIGIASTLQTFCQITGASKNKVGGKTQIQKLTKRKYTRRTTQS